MSLKDWKKTKGGWKKINKELALAKNWIISNKKMYDVYLRTFENYNWVILKHATSKSDAIKFAKLYMRNH